MTPHYIKQLNADMKADLDRRAAKDNLNRTAEAAAARDRLVPLDVRLGRLLATIPAEVQRGGLSLPTLQTMLKGRQGGTCHSGELGTALRAGGWIQTRCWRKSTGGFRALWYPSGQA